MITTEQYFNERLDRLQIVAGVNQESRHKAGLDAMNQRQLYLAVLAQIHALSTVDHEGLLDGTLAIPVLGWFFIGSGIMTGKVLHAATIT
jgi:hypothetical protein